MCGIAGIYLKNKRVKVTQENIGSFCDRLLLEIEPRGKHATGFVSIGWDGSIKLDKAAKPASEFIKEREEFQPGVQAVLLHTRFKTKGTPEVMGNNHPVSYNTCFTTHNGSIWNDDELFKQEELKRNFEVDSEVIPAILDKYGLDTPDTIRAGLEKLGGAMAIATMDPVKHPKKLILAKGVISPLYVFENQNVIVWASEHSAIKDTWGDLVGTPPKSDKIKFVGEGKFLIAQDCQDLGIYEFSPKKKPVIERIRSVSRGLGPRQQSQQRQTGQGTNFHRPWDAAGPFHTKGDFFKALGELRRNPPEDFVIARRWDLRESYDSKTDFKDVEGTLQWPNCMCGHAILMEDMQRHIKYGLICKDCYKTIYNAWMERGRKWEQEEAARRESDVLAGIEFHEIPEGDRTNLESWVEIECRLHRYTLSDLSDRTGYTTQALDFLMFRTHGKSSDYGAGMTELKFHLIKAYDKLYAKICEEHWEEVLDEVDADRKITVETAQEIADQQQYPWTSFIEMTVHNPTQRIKYICEVHQETFSFGEHCHSCVFADREDEKDAWGTEDFQRGDTSEGWCDGDECGVRVTDAEVTPIHGGLTRCECGTWYADVCIPCEKKKETAVVTVDACCCKTTRDRKCKHNLKIVVNNSLIGKQLGYCGLHWNRCAASKCANKANFTGLSGQRYCHAHSRKKSGIADAAAIKDGTLNIIMEVK